MSISSARRAGRKQGGKRALSRTAGIVAVVVLALAVAAPAWATMSATATLAPIGSGSYLVTVTNTGSETITSFTIVPTEFIATSIVPSSACRLDTSPFIQLITCSVTVAPATQTQVCFSGHALWASAPGFGGFVEGSAYAYLNISPSPTVASCPLPGFTAGSGGISESTTPGSSSTASSGSTPGSTPVVSGKGAHRWSHAQCKSTYKAWTKKHHHATRSQKKAEANKLHKTHGCPLSILK